jgi:predicted dehydrogenase
VEEAEQLVAAAERAKVILMTNNWRRNCTAFREIKRLISTGQLGQLQSASWSEGLKFSWPTKSGFYFTQRSRDNLPPPGVLLDVGSHVIDLLCWWLGSNPTVLECRTDSFGGPEARATLVLDFAGVRVQTDLSNYQKLTNTYNLLFDGGKITGNTGEEHRFILTGLTMKPIVIRLARTNIPIHATQMITSFVNAVAGRGQPIVTGRDVISSIKAISSGYRCAKPYDAVWLPRSAA